MFKQAKDLLSFKAFKPSKSDVKVQLRERFFKSGSIMGISISKHCLTCAEIQFASPAGAEISKVKIFPVTINCEEDKQEETELKAEEESVSIITAFAKENGLSHALLLNSPEIQIQKVNRASRKIGVDRLYDIQCAMDIMFAGPVEEGRAYRKEAFKIRQALFPEDHRDGADSLSIDSFWIVESDENSVGRVYNEFGPKYMVYGLLLF
ncbi:hypothetical protein AYO37_01315 [Opitutia bacterium SCGC AG-212-L18]|nr:hypothetical protein AYO37_01315 [Opitutae bacterium SCGC AG-212-L18]